jgi:hypothetical protein
MTRSSASDESTVALTLMALPGAASVNGVWSMAWPPGNAGPPTSGGRVDLQGPLELLDAAVALLEAAHQHHPDVDLRAGLGPVVEPFGDAQFQRLLEVLGGLLDLQVLVGLHGLPVQLGHLLSRILGLSDGRL